MPPYTAWQETRDLKQYYLNGFPSLAAFIASDKDKTTFIFKKFDGLAARSLIHLQSKLADLQKLQDEYDAEEAKQDLHRKQLSHNWSDFCQAAVSDPKQKARLELAEQIQATLKDYLTALPRPSKQTLSAFSRKFFNSKSGEETFPTLGGSSATLYDDMNDLITVNNPGNPDRLTTFVQNHLSFFFRSGDQTAEPHMLPTRRSRNSYPGWVSCSLLFSSWRYGWECVNHVSTHLLKSHATLIVDHCNRVFAKRSLEMLSAVSRTSMATDLFVEPKATHDCSFWQPFLLHERFNGRKQAKKVILTVRSTSSPQEVSIIMRTERVIRPFLQRSRWDDVLVRREQSRLEGSITTLPGLQKPIPIDLHK